MADSIFTKIIKGEIPSHKVYEDDKTYAFMDIQPIQTGMVLVVPKTEVEHFHDLDEEFYQALWAAVQKVAKKMKKVFPDKRVGVMVEGLEVPHVHVKLFPFNTAKEFRSMPTTADLNHQELAKLAAKISKA